MKKIIAVLLVVLMCLPLVACQSDALGEKIGELEEMLNLSQSKIDRIIGTWAFDDEGYNANTKLTIKEDNTFTFTKGDDVISGKWTYFSDIDTAMMVAEGMIEYAIFEEKDGVLRINMEGEYAEKED